MHKLGHCGGDARLMEIISYHLEVRECFNHEEDDAGGRAPRIETVRDYPRNEGNIPMVILSSSK
ncbi:hypothetical protein ALC57_14505 [Trachymyrmex cornetzi]|uniref:Uncharacterized protein n=1 Tax=Trachymyrmex cornetzi TaxID=471704 RepID=A0A151IYP6_9HYME|nr:hypothetical protein ALC57_14505 [Trachymyrmex cornetzi]